MPNEAEPGRETSTSSWLFTIGIVILPVAYVLTFYLDQGAWLFAAIRAFLVAVAISLTLVGVASVLLRSRTHGALVGLSIVVMLFVYRLPATLTLLAAFALTIALISLFGSRLRPVWPRAVHLLHNSIGVFGFALLIVTIAQFGLRGQIFGFGAQGATAPAESGAPDIWLVLLDAYPRADVLEREWDFDSSEFLEGLEGLGFSVASDARSNYNMTKLTLPAMLNMALLQDLQPWSDYDKPADAPAADRVQALQHSPAFDVLRDHGYRITSIGAGYTHEDIRAVDAFVDAGTADVVELDLLGRTAVGEMVQAIDPRFGERQIGRRVEANLETLAGLSREPSERPQFVFTHIPSPHPPLAFATIERPFVPLHDAFGYQVEMLGDELLREAYQEHITGLNDRVLSTLETVVDAVYDEAVVIVMSDHGSREDGHEHSLSPAEVDEQFSTLFAARVPDGEVLFDDDVMATNVLSTVFNRYLGTEFPMVERVFESLDGTRYEE